MTINEIFEKIILHMQQGIIIHDEISKAYTFIGLQGYAKCHEYHLVEEHYNYRKLNQYYMIHYHKLIQLNYKQEYEIIPENWYKYTMLEVDTNSRYQAIKILLDKWIKWEEETKEFYQTMYSELCSLDEISAAIELQYYIHDVDNELAEAQTELIKLQSMEYDIATIIDWQPILYKQFKKKLTKIY